MPKYLRETIEHYQIMAEVYDSTYKDENREIIYQPFLKYLKGKSVLDVGCGAGRASQYFIGKNQDVTAVDLTPRFLELAKINAPKAKIMPPMDMRDLKFPDQSFDGLWVCLSLHHLKKAEHRKTLQEFHRVLKSDGVLFLEMKEGDGEEAVYSKWSKLKRLFSFYKKEELSTLVESCHFKVIEASIEADPPGQNLINLYARKVV